MAIKRAPKARATKTRRVKAQTAAGRPRMAAQHADHTREFAARAQEKNIDYRAFEAKRGKQALPYGMDERMENRPHIEREDGVLRDPVRWNGTIASFVKEISRGENGYDPERQMVLLQTADGECHVAPFSDISKNVVPTVAMKQVADRVPDASNVPYTPTKVRV